MTESPQSAPATVYVYNDLPYVLAARPGDAALVALVDELLQALEAEPRVRLLSVDVLVEALARSPVAAPFAHTLAIGGAGTRVARLLHARTGWFPSIETLAITREEANDTGYRIIGSGGGDPEQQLAALTGKSLALVDDTIYSGLTLAWALDRLSAPMLTGTCIFALQAVQQALPPLRGRCAVYAGIELPGERERDLTVIKASHLFERGAIRRPAGDLAFYQRPAWMRAWFPLGAARITALCTRLDPAGPAPGDP